MKHSNLQTVVDRKKQTKKEDKIIYDLTDKKI